MINLGLAVGMMFAALFLLRPLLVRILSPGQRVALWVVGWISLYSPSFYGLLSLVHILPVTFRDLYGAGKGRRHGRPQSPPICPWITTGRGCTICPCPAGRWCRWKSGRG